MSVGAQRSRRNRPNVVCAATNAGDARREQLGSSLAPATPVSTCAPVLPASAREAGPRATQCCLARDAGTAADNAIPGLEYPNARDAP